MSNGWRESERPEPPVRRINETTGTKTTGTEAATVAAKKPSS